MNKYDIIVDFGEGISSDIQGVYLLRLERMMREETGLPVEAFKRTMPDDSKLRVNMTPLERSKL